MEVCRAAVESDAHSMKIHINEEISGRVTDKIAQSARHLDILLFSDSAALRSQLSCQSHAKNKTQSAGCQRQ
jgi:hypothetical protein